ncbi:MAG: outer spore coat protein CotE [Bacillota bacterium]
MNQVEVGTFGRIKEILARAVCGVGEARIARTVDIPSEGSPRQILGTMATPLELGAVTVDVSGPGRVRVEGVVGVHVWYMAEEQTHVVSHSVAISEDIPLTLLGTGCFAFSAPTVQCDPVSVSAQPRGAAIRLQVATRVKVEVVGEVRVGVRAFSGGAVAPALEAPTVESGIETNLQEDLDVGDWEDED